MASFKEFFCNVTGFAAPFGWQRSLGSRQSCANLLIRVPTGFGKTLGVFSAWLFNRVFHQDDGWPRRLVWCLPMRVLVEQTEQEIRKALRAMNLLWERGDHAGKVGVHLLMGERIPASGTCIPNIRLFSSVPRTCCSPAP